MGVAVGVGFGVLVGVAVGVGVGGSEGGGVTKPEPLGKGVKVGSGVGSPGNDSIADGPGDGDGPGEGLVGTKIGSDDTGVPVGLASATPPPGRAKVTSIAPTIRPARARPRAARIGNRLFPDDTGRRRGYVTPAASPPTGRRW